MIRITAVAHLIIDTASDTVRFFFTTWKREAFFSGTCARKMILRYFSIEAYK